MAIVPDTKIVNDDGGDQYKDDKGYTDPLPPPDKPCCCPAHVRVWGCTSQVLASLPNEWIEDKEMKTRADANASVSPPGGPQVNADGSGGSLIRTRVSKEVDLVMVTVTYKFEWDVMADCKQAVTVVVLGDVNTRVRCAPEKGHIELSRSRVMTMAEVNRSPRGNATATVTATDCSGSSVSCDFTLFEH